MLAPGNNDGGLWKHAGTIVIAVYCAICVYSFAVSDAQHLLGRLSDDAFYYCTIAANYAETGHLTFDGQTITNGFHPLWLGLLIPVFQAVRDPILALRVVGIISTALVALAAYGAWYFLRRWYSWTAAVFGMLIVLFYARGFAHSCMETSLVLPLSMVTLVFLDRSDPWGSARPSSGLLLLSGCTLSLVQLARLDAVFLSLAVLMTVAHASWRRFGFRAAASRVALLASMPIVSGASYLALNHARFGHFIPVSGMAKSLGATGFNVKFAQQLLYLPGAADRGVVWFVYTMVLVLCLLWVVREGYRLLGYGPRHDSPRGPGSRLGIQCAAALFMVFQTAWYLLRSSWHAWPWYTYPAFLAGCFVVPAWSEVALAGVGQSLRSAARSVAAVACVVALAVMVRNGIWAYRPPSESYMYQNYKLALVLNGQLGSDARLAMGDCAASLGYFFEGQVLQLEGLVGDYEILNAIRENRLDEYMTRFGVTHIVAFEDLPREYSEWILAVPSAYHTTGPRAEVIVQGPNEILRDDTGRTPLVVWRWSENR